MKRLIVGGALIVLPLAAGSILTIGTLTHYSCIDCGMYREVKDCLGFKKSRQERRDRTDWYDRRVGLPHEHQWIQTSCTTGMNLWQATTGYTYGESEPLASDELFLAKLLCGLERPGLDLEFNRHATHPDRRHRIAAAQVWLVFYQGYYDRTVPQWWDKAQTYLADRSLWVQSFRRWAYPLPRMTGGW